MDTQLPLLLIYYHYYIYRINLPSTSNQGSVTAGTAHKTSERNIKFYPTSISVTGGVTSKNSFMVRNYTL